MEAVLRAIKFRKFNQDFALIGSDQGKDHTVLSIIVKPDIFQGKTKSVPAIVGIKFFPTIKRNTFHNELVFKRFDGRCFFGHNIHAIAHDHPSTAIKPAWALVVIVAGRLLFSVLGKEKFVSYLHPFDKKISVSPICSSRTTAVIV